MNPLQYCSTFLLIAILFFIPHLHAQTTNWGMNNIPTHQITAKIAVEYGIIYGIGYSSKVNEKFCPILAEFDISAPIGASVFDDFKSRAGIRVHLFNIDNFHLSTEIKGVFRQFQNKNVAIKNFGADFNAILGYYKPNWFAAAEIGFDKAIASHYKHLPAYMETYPEVKNGWIDPAMGGNFKFGIQSGYSLKNLDFTIQAGILKNQDLVSNPLLPFYGLIGVNHRF